MYCIPIRAAKYLREHIIWLIYLAKKWPIIVLKTYTTEKKKVLACKSELLYVHSYLCMLNAINLQRGNYLYFLLTLYTLTSVCIFSILFPMHFQRGWQGEFVSQSRAALVGDHLLYSHNFHVWFRCEIVRRNQMLVSLRG